ncbi:MAG: glycerol dehydrogenase [Candidatus Methanomethylophilaceae archaeon]
MNARETAWRIFAGELNNSSLEKKGADEKSPSYLITPLGAMVNRVMIAGVLLEKTNTGTEEEPMWKGRIQDVSGSFFINVGKFQPEASAAMVDIETPSFVAVVGKVRTYTADDGRVFVSVRPERIINIDDATRNFWVLESAQSMWKRLIAMKNALQTQDPTIDDLVAKGFPPQDAEGIISALDHYGMPESSKYLRLVQNSMRLLLPDRSIDLGLPEDMNDLPDEIDMDEGRSKVSSSDKEDIILRLLDELDEGHGAPRPDLEKRAEVEGISGMEVEEISNTLMDKGLVYEPNLGYLKKI